VLYFENIKHKYMQLQKATRKKAFMRLNLSAPSGAGKTYSALLMAKGLVGSWDKIAVIDTESGSASLYSHLGEYNVIDLDPPYSPERYIQAIDACLKSGIECIILDSSSHEWSGSGGCLDSNDKLAQAKYKGNTWSAWNETTPRHDSFVNKVLQCRAHVITCTRSKMETVMGEDKKVKKVGMKDIQREGWEYELTVSLSIDRDTHMAIASKDRTELFEGQQPFVITEQTGVMIKNWCESGADVPPTAPPAPEKKRLTDKAVIQAVARINGGEATLKANILEAYELTDEQKAMIDAANPAPASNTAG
jgi:AAA domain-containing protein